MILMECLKKMDELQTFDRTVAKSCVLLDGYGSRIGLDFLSCVNDDVTRWFMLIGVPYGVAKWQVGDSRHQNGCYKMMIANTRKSFSLRKNDFNWI